ncbi:polysaccharide biosynthesis/export family protein [Rheinheimera sp. UJ63]|uniref:polysaccharide biosynthesis/export family protein n=1 Tax=Rheinheimera sp. UJ63 TaxID=2910157 RepID=UPI001F1B3144|nr:SLBB domain-containing protein [Rheinheimera sp. UJ63]MCF4009271.1 SLBB domain-containing protein [Rheinheimera sp. UJ63]
MRLSTRFFRTLAFSAAAVLFTASATAQISAAQIEQFKQLPRAQQEALAAQYGVDLNQLTGQANTQAATPAPSLQQLTPMRQVTAPENDNSIETATGMLDKSTDDTFDTATSKQKPRNLRQSLKQFGYDLFAGSPTTFAPISDAPVPVNYVVGPGDTIRIQLYGKENLQQELTVDRNGQIFFPNIGPLMVTGLTFNELKQNLNAVVEQQMIGNQINVTMGSLRSIRVFVLGEAFQPGAYTISSLSTATHAVLAAGGVKKIGSLRNIEIKRSGKTVAKLDLYDLLLRGDTSGDVTLQPGDVVFIPTVERTVGIGGEVLRPAIYELKNEKTANDIVRLAGGFLPTAFPAASRLERIDRNGAKLLKDIDLTQDSGKNAALWQGDIIEVYSVLDQIDNIVKLTGHVHRPGGFGWRQGMRISDVLPDIRELLPNPDLNYGIIRRETFPTREIEVIAFNPGRAITQPASAANLALQPRDTLYLFGSNDNREERLASLITELRDQARFLQPPKVVSLRGYSRFSGEFPLTEGMTLGNLLQAGFDLDQFADKNYALLARFNSQTVKTSVQVVSLAEPSSLAIQLQALDKLYVFSMTEPREPIIVNLVERLLQQADKDVPQLVVNIEGDVRFPGRYPLTAGMSAQQLIEVAGGFKESSYAVTAELTSRTTDGSTMFSTQHRELPLAAAANTALAPLDTLQIKRIPDWRESTTVKLVGEVQFPGTYTIKRGERLADVINRAGGFSNLAHPEATVFSRASIRENEAKQLAALRLSLQQQLAAEAVTATGNNNTVAEAEELSSKLNETQAIGRLVIDMNGALAGNNGQNIELENGDEIFIPQRRNAISIIGEVHSPSSHVFTSGLSVQDYLNRAGGFKQRADKDAVYVIKADGSVMNSTNSWFALNRNRLEAGDTIVVPLNTEYKDGLTIWATATQIIYNSAVAIAAIATL